MAKPLNLNDAILACNPSTSFTNSAPYTNYSKVVWNEGSPIVSQEDFAIYKTNFTRFNNQDIELISTDTNLTLIKRGDYWKLKIAIIPINISTGK